jgi:NhaP-type Na+/H+ or K+/H+ antiporter
VSLGFLAALGILGGLLILLALGAAGLRDRPVTVAMLYLLVGIALGPLGIDAIDPRITDGWFLRATELAVLASLFASGMKVRARWRTPGLRAAIFLAFPGLVVTALVVMLGAHLILGLPWEQAFLLGALMAPTDPVLASEVALRSPGDHDRFRTALTAEAGLNDGTAFPLVALGVLATTSSVPLEAPELVRWAMERVIWAVPAGLTIGALIGWSIGRLAFAARARSGKTEGIDELLAVGVVALSYVTAEALHAWGFLSVFATGVALRRAEVFVVEHAGLPAPSEIPRLVVEDGAPADALVAPSLDPRAQAHPTVAAATVLHDTSRLAGTLERIGEIAVVVCAGAMLARAFVVEGLVLAVIVFVIARPIGVATVLSPIRLGRREKGAAAWLGIRGAGTLYYLAWAASEGALSGSAASIVDLAITCVATSIVLHGITATPLVRWLDRRAARREARSAAEGRPAEGRPAGGESIPATLPSSPAAEGGRSSAGTR